MIQKQLMKHGMLNQIKIAVIFLLVLVGCTEKETQVEVSSVSLNTATIEMIEGETFSLVATVLPKDAEYDGVMWASSNASVASVNSGTVTAVKEGTATITASAGGKSSTCTVKVSAKVVTVTSITLDKTSLSMQVGETETITATVNPDNATDKSVTWGSSDVSVATVADGRVTAKKSGTAIITAKSGSCVAECTVTISVDVESVTLDKTTLSLAVGETTQLTATVKPDDATDKNVNWISSDESIATVANGKVTAVKSGKATITARCGDKTAECAVTVTVPTGSVTLDKTTLSLAVGESATLTAMVKPDDATDKNVTWTSSDESVAKVADGKVTAVKSGKATITAKCGGKTAECAVTVTVPVVSVILDKTTLSLAVGETAQLTATVKPDNATDKNVIWTSSDESVAKVVEGKVTAVKSGKAIITAKCAGKTAECAVTVTVPVGSVILDKTTISLAVGESAQLTATVKPDNATDKTIVWISSDESVAEVINGKVTALKSGTTTITARCGNKSAECIVTVIVPVSSVTLDKNDLMLLVGDAATLIVTVKPDNATSKNVTWSSSNEAVATVKNGNVVAVKEGEAIISASVGNISASCKVVVINANRVIKYTAESSVTPFNQDAFGAKIISNEYSYPNGMIIFDDPVIEIGRNAFYKCQTLTTIVIPENVSAIGDNAFMNCEKLSSIDIPESVTSIGIAAFKECHSLSDIILPNNVTTIEKEAFYWCWALSKVIFPKNLKTIGEYAFHLTKIKILDLPNGLQSIEESAFLGCKNITNLIIPDSVVSIGRFAFQHCESLLSVEIHEGVTVLSVGCFSGCSLLSTVKLPNSINMISDLTFNECKVLDNLYLKASIPPKLYDRAFGDNTAVNIWVPRASVEAYKEKWNAYKDNIKAYDF